MIFRGKFTNNNLIRQYFATFIKDYILLFSLTFPYPILS